MIQTPCVDHSTLLMLEDGTLPLEKAEAARAHVRSCPRCRALAAELDELGEAALRFADTRASGPCPDALLLGAFAEGRLAARERAGCEAHLAACGRCSADLAALARELAGLEVEPGVETPAWALERARALVEVPAVASREEAAAAVAARASLSHAARVGEELRSRPAGPAWPERFAEALRRAALPLAAAASVALMVLVQLPEPGQLGPGIRGTSSTGAATGIVLITPSEGGSLMQARGTFRWEPVAGAETYTVTVVDPAGAVVWTTRTSDTRVAVPANLVLGLGESYAWWVETVLDTGEEVESPVSHFTATP